MNRDRPQAAQILLVEDSPADIALTREVLEESRVLAHLDVVEDGQAALDFLERAKTDDRTRLPDLILLDLNLPKRNGFEVLKDIKSDPELRRIPVVVLTTSDEERDVFESYDLQANSFITKPMDFQQFHSVIRAIEDFWFSVVRLPR